MATLGSDKRMFNPPLYQMAACYHKLERCCILSSECHNSHVTTYSMLRSIVLFPSFGAPFLLQPLIIMTWHWIANRCSCGSSESVDDELALGLSFDPEAPEKILGF